MVTQIIKKPNFQVFSDEGQIGGNLIISKFAKGYLQKLVFQHLVQNLFWQSSNT
jgi:hypothetical protein